MDVALRVAERVTMMHDGARDRRGHAGRDPREPDGARPLPRARARPGCADEPLLARRGPRRLLRHARRRSRTCRSRWAAESIAIIGRNGMGKTTLCNAIMGIPPAARRRLDPLPAARSSSAGRRTRSRKLGIGYVPQGRRLFPSLSVDEHLRMIARPRLGQRWTRRRASTSSSRASPSASGTAARSSRAASSRCSRSGGRCSTNPTLLIMDEPSEGLAPAIVEHLIETFRTLERGGPRDPADRAEPRRRHRARRAPARDGRRADLRRDDGRGARRPTPSRSGASSASSRSRETRGRDGDVVLLGTLDTKGAEYAFLRDRLREHGVDVLLVDAGVARPRRSSTPDIARDEVAARRRRRRRRLAAAGDRGAAVDGDGARRRGGRRAAARRGAARRVLASAAPAARRSRRRRCARCPSACRS